MGPLYLKLLLVCTSTTHPKKVGDYSILRWAVTVSHPLHHTSIRV